MRPKAAQTMASRSNAFHDVPTMLVPPGVWDQGVVSRDGSVFRARGLRVWGHEESTERRGYFSGPCFCPAEEAIRPTTAQRWCWVSRSLSIKPETAQNAPNAHCCFESRDAAVTSAPIAKNERGGTLYG